MLIHSDDFFDKITEFSKDGLCIIAITLAIPSAIFAEAGLSYLGIGINEPTPSLGKMVADSAPYVRVYWHLGVFPTVAIGLIMLGFSFVGDGLRDALDPRQM